VTTCRRAVAALPAALLTLALAAAGKAHAATAGPEELRWILGPTAALVGALLGSRFPWEAGVGYRSLELGVAITPGCAGVNFLVIALCALSFGFGSRFRPTGRLLWVAAAAALAGVATVGANAARILATVALRGLEAPLGLSFDALHRLEGVAVYLGALLLALSLVERALGAPPGPRAPAHPEPGPG